MWVVICTCMVQISRVSRRSIEKLCHLPLANMCLTNYKVLTNNDLTAAVVQHYDATIFPDDSHWYTLFESHILENSLENIRVIQSFDHNTGATLVFPLICKNKSWRGLIFESMHNYYSVDYRPLCSTVGARAMIAPMLSAILRNEAPDMLRLLPMDAQAPETETIKVSLQKLGWRVHTENCQINWIHDFKGSYEDYIASRPGKLRSTIKRRGARLLALKGISMVVHNGLENLDQLLAFYKTIYDRSWKVPEPHDQFMPALISQIAVKGQLRLGLIKIDDRPIAVHFWIVKYQHAYIFKLAHDKAFDAYSPGTVLMAEMVRFVMENDQVTRLDFMSGDDKYKQDWMSERREKLLLTAYNPRSLHGSLAQIVDLHIKPFVMRIARWFRASKVS